MSIQSKPKSGVTVIFGALLGLLLSSPASLAGGTVSLGTLTCTTFESAASGGQSASVSCSAAYPHPLNGGCNGPKMTGTNMGRINQNYISGTTQYCYTDANLIDAFITCCQ